MRSLRQWIRKHSFRGLSLQQRLPLLIFVLLILVFFTLSLVNHYSISQESVNLKWMIIIGVAVTLFAVFVTWYMSVNITKPLQQLTKAATNIASGNYYAPQVSNDRLDEIGKLSRAFAAMTAKVNRCREELEMKVEETEQMTKLLRDLSAHLQDIREEERIRIARGMQDELGQLLAGFKMDLSWLQKRMAKSRDPFLKAKLKEMLEATIDAGIFVRKLSYELRPGILDDLGLVAALEWHCREFKNSSGVNAEFHSAREEIQLPREAAISIFRICQESLSNVARHADASKVGIEIEMNEGLILLSITDDGKGFDIQNAKNKMLGILSMRERASILGGQLRIYSAPGKGTTVLVTVPQYQAIYD